MLQVYTRHLTQCAHSEDNHWRRCHCPKWIRGVLLTGKKIRRSAQTGSWEGAEKQARKPEGEIDPERDKIEAQREVTLREAVKTFLSDQNARGLGKETQKKYRGFLERQFLVWADAHKMKFLVKVSPAELTKFRAKVDSPKQGSLLPSSPQSLIQLHQRQQLVELGLHQV